MSGPGGRPRIGHPGYGLPRPAARDLSRVSETRQVLALPRSPSGAEPAPGNRDLEQVRVPRRGHHRVPASGTARHSRATLAAVATGATVAAGQSMIGGVDALVPSPETVSYTVLAAEDAGLVQSTSPQPKPVTAALLKHGPTRQSPDLAVMDIDTDVADVQSLVKGVAVGEALAGGARTLRAALNATTDVPGAVRFRGRQFVRPTSGIFTSGFGSRWGTTHYGIDIANRIGTPIYAVSDGTVVESGPASGFGLWVKIKHADGFTSVYGHINRSLVREGQQVRAGQKIAEMGNRGQSTGPHLHLEIWDANKRKINPIPWLAARGIRILGIRLDPR